MEAKRKPGLRPRVIRCGLLLALAALRIEAGEAAAFDPGRHVEPGSLARLWIADAARLRESLGATDIGRVLGSPAGRQLLATAWIDADGPLGRLDVAWKEWCGRSLADTLALLPGAVVLDVDAPSAAGSESGRAACAVPWTLAIELGESRTRILEIVSRVSHRLEARTGRASAVTAARAPSHQGPLHHALVGGYLLVSSSDARIEAAVRAHAASVGRPVDHEGSGREASGGDSESSRERPWTAPPEVSVPRAEVLARVRLQPLLDWLLGSFTAVDPADAKALLKGAGIDALETLWFALGSLDRGVETAWSVTSRGGARGIVEVLQRGCGRLADVSGVLALVPEGATRIHGLGLRVGGFLRGLDRYARRSVPEIGPQLDAAYRDVEEFSGVSVRGELFELGDLSVYAFGIAPPRGSSPDRIVLVRTAELRPYWSALEKLALRRGLPWRSVPSRANDPGASVRYVYLSPWEPRELVDGASMRWTSAARWCSSMLSDLLPAAARLDRSDGWTALSTSPQALVRYRDFYALGGMLACRSAAASFVLETLEGSSAAIVLREAEVPARASGELLRLLRSLAPTLARAGVDLSALPPVETFPRPDAPGRARFEWSASGFTARTQRVLPVALVTTLVALGGTARPETAFDPE